MTLSPRALAGVFVVLALLLFAPGQASAQDCNAPGVECPCAELHRAPDGSPTRCYVQDACEEGFFCSINSICSRFYECADRACDTDADCDEGLCVDGSCTCLQDSLEEGSSIACETSETCPWTATCFEQRCVYGIICPPADDLADAGVDEADSGGSGDEEDSSGEMSDGRSVGTPGSSSDGCATQSGASSPTSVAALVLGRLMMARRR